MQRKTNTPNQTKKLPPPKSHQLHSPAPPVILPPPDQNNSKISYQSDNKTTTPSLLVSTLNSCLDEVRKVDFRNSELERSLRKAEATIQNLNSELEYTKGLLKEQSTLTETNLKLQAQVLELEKNVSRTPRGLSYEELQKKYNELSQYYNELLSYVRDIEAKSSPNNNTLSVAENGFDSD